VVVMAVILKIRKKISQRKIVGSCHQYLMMWMNRILITFKMLVIGLYYIALI
jgi:hypothetical protein